ncbi:hypothetical protein P618_200493 [Holospora obtusa F1]|uniref:Uncharacterized protein n=1 Tax=Holospora obtusa F1 TaxID=1399147 RepID=W6THE1_HOLOB|nr:hypothetical protein [Holospora obtusa]ETZ07310.1 hypothetical protein P618_200493 [Holospora obtusa F1]
MKKIFFLLFGFFSLSALAIDMGTTLQEIEKIYNDLQKNVYELKTPDFNAISSQEIAQHIKKIDYIISMIAQLKQSNNLIEIVENTGNDRIFWKTQIKKMVKEIFDESSKEERKRKISLKDFNFSSIKISPAHKHLKFSIQKTFSHILDYFKFVNSRLVAAYEQNDISTLDDRFKKIKLNDDQIQSNGMSLKNHQEPLASDESKGVTAYERNDISTLDDRFKKIKLNDDQIQSNGMSLKNHQEPLASDESKGVTAYERNDISTSDNRLKKIKLNDDQIQSNGMSLKNHQEPLASDESKNFQQKIEINHDQTQLNKISLKNNQRKNNIDEFESFQKRAKLNLNKIQSDGKYLPILKKR